MSSRSIVSILVMTVSQIDLSFRCGPFQKYSSDSFLLKKARWLPQVDKVIDGHAGDLLVVVEEVNDGLLVSGRPTLVLDVPLELGLDERLGLVTPSSVTEWEVLSLANLGAVLEDDLDLVGDGPLLWVQVALGEGLVLGNKGLGTDLVNLRGSGGVLVGVVDWVQLAFEQGDSSDPGDTVVAVSKVVEFSINSEKGR